MRPVCVGAKGAAHSCPFAVVKNLLEIHHCRHHTNLASSAAQCQAGNPPPHRQRARWRHEGHTQNSAHAHMRWQKGTEDKQQRLAISYRLATNCTYPRTRNTLHYICCEWRFHFHTRPKFLRGRLFSKNNRLFFLLGPFLADYFLIIFFADNGYPICPFLVLPVPD